MKIVIVILRSNNHYSFSEQLVKRWVANNWLIVNVAFYERKTAGLGFELN